MHLCLRRSFDDVTRINFRFRLLVVWSSVHLPVKFGANIFIQSGVIDIYPKFKMAVAPSWIFRLYEFGYSGVLTVWYSCSVQNWVKIYALVTEIDALMLQTFI